MSDDRPIEEASREDLRRQFEALGSPVRLLEEIFLHAPVGLQLFEAGGRSVLVNPAHTQMFGGAPGAAYNIFEDPLLESAGIAPLVRRAFAGERVHSPPRWYGAVSLCKGDQCVGRRVAVSAEMVPLRTVGAEASHVLMVISDVTDSMVARERAEEAARRAAFLADAGRLLSSTLDFGQTLSRLARLSTPTLADCCIVDLVEPDGSVRRVAAAHADPLAQSIMDELLEHPPVPGSLQPARKVLNSGNSELVPELDATLDEYRPDPLLRALLLRLGMRSHLAVPMRIGSRVVGVISLGYVLSRRYGPDDLVLAEALASQAAVAIDNARLHDEVARSEEHFRRMADSVPQLVWVTDPEGHVEFLNRQWGVYTGDDAPVGSVVEAAARFLHPDDVAGTVASFEHANRFGQDLLVEYRFRSATGEYRWFMGRGVAQRDPHTAKLVRWYGTSVDIHDLKLAEAALRDADRRKDEFLAMLAHELRNPLAAIANACWLMRSRGTGPELERDLDVLSRQTGRLTHLVDDLLDVSRVTRGLITLRQEPVELGGLVNHALEGLHELLQDRRHAVHLDMPSQPVVVTGDPGRLEQIVLNLVTNAAKYTDPGGNIEIELRADEAIATLSVRDSGIGIAPEFLDHLFDMFSQAERGLARSRGGLGVGLTIVRRLAELHGGTVSAHSAGLGQGATFRVSLPLGQQGADGTPLAADR